MPRRPKLPPARRPKPKRRAPFKKTSQQPKPPRLHIYSILEWADAYHEKTGKWPTSYSGEIPEAPWDTWRKVDYSLRGGCRGCRGHSSLAILLHKHRGRPLPLPRPRPRLSVKQILAWADAWHRRTGNWPSQYTRGLVAPGRDETWRALSNSLHRGGRGLRGKDSLAKILLRYRNVRRARYLPRLTIKQILMWADEHHARTGRWPSFGSGAVKGVPGERWAALHADLQNGLRGLKRGYTLATLLEKYRGQPYKRTLPPYTEKQILAWADAYYKKNKAWPTLYSGAIAGTVGETWRKIEGGLSKGRRGLPGGDSLSQLLMRNERRPFRDWKKRVVRRERLTIKQILAWADDFHRREDRWPATLSGPIPGQKHEDWKSIDNALRTGIRGLPGGSSIALLLEEKRGKVHKHHRPRITIKSVLEWADAYHERTGRWPACSSGLIAQSGTDTWQAIDCALRQGGRGLPGGSNLTQFLKRHGRHGRGGPRKRK